MLELVVDVPFGMSHASAAGRDVLHLARRHPGLVTETVFVCQCPSRHIGDNLDIAMRVGLEPRSGLNVIFHYDPQRAEVDPLRILVFAERERNPVVGPPEVFEGALAAPADAKRR